MMDEHAPEGAGSGSAGFDPGSSARGVQAKGSLDAVLDLELPVSIELGRTHMSVEDVLALGKGSVVQLDRLVGQPVEVYVSDKRFATGEVVVMGEQFGVRIISIQDLSLTGEEGV